jgi:hypothetical protein
MIYRGKFELAPYNPSLLNIDTLHNPPIPPKGGCCGGGGSGGSGGGSISFDSLNIPEHYYFIDDIARDTYFENHDTELQKDVVVVSGGQISVYNGNQWVFLAFIGNTGTGSAETITIEKEAAETINGHRLVACNQSGKIITATWNYPEVIGLITRAVSAGEKVLVIVFGVVKHEGWSFDLVRPILLSNDGRPVQDTITSYPVITRVGKPIATDSFLVTIELPLR